MNRLDAARSALVIIDIQERLVPAIPAAQMADVQRAVSILLEAARVLNVPVLATEQYPQGLGRTVPVIAEKFASMSIKPFEKTAFSAVDAPEFSKALFALSPRHVILVGMETHICVFQTARDLAASGIEVHVPLDGVASRRDDHREVGLRLCERAGALRTTAETVAFDWLVRAGTDPFRAVSKAVR